MNKGRVGEDRGSKEMDGCPLTHMRHNVFDTGSRGEWNGNCSGGSRDRILSVIVI
jgi:hypothetical protein